MNGPRPERSVTRLFYTVEEAAEMLGISRTLAYELTREFLTTKQSGLPCMRLGTRRIVIARRTIERMANLDGHPDGDDPKEAA
jgi:Helix-turn-helix domain